MSERHPASLVYLLIYNPTLSPPSNVPVEDDDAQEEAHIMFYTSRDRVTSRHRMLRQVGLAKALVNFTQIFSSAEQCDYVHSQGKRLVSVSPEPNFWMHACIEVAKTPSQSKDKKKKAAGNASTYHYHNDSVNDNIIRSHLLLGYEEFKLLYGSYTSILSGGGSPALQLRLEHFFTPWAWRWDLESDVEFQNNFGVPLYPTSTSLNLLLTELYDCLPQNMLPLLLCRPYVIPFPNNSASRIPWSLSRYLWTVISDSAQEHVAPSRISKNSASKENNTAVKLDTSSNSSLYGTLVNSGLGDVMNVKKWRWPTTFGVEKVESKSKEHQIEEQRSEDDIAKEALVSGTPHPPNRRETPDINVTVEHAALKDAINTTIQNTEFLSFTVHFSRSEHGVETRRQKVLYLSFRSLIFALVTDCERLEEITEEQRSTLVVTVSSCLTTIWTKINEEPSDPPLTKESKRAEKSAYIVSNNEHIISTQGKISKPSFPYLLDNRETITRNPHLKEIFSRSLQPQTWFATRHGVAMPTGDEESKSGVYLQVTRKEASLVDVDNEVDGAIKRLAVT